MWKREDRRQTSETLYTVYYCIWSEEYTVYNQNKVIQLSMLTANEHYKEVQTRFDWNQEQCCTVGNSTGLWFIRLKTMYMTRQDKRQEETSGQDKDQRQMTQQRRHHNAQWDMTPGRTKKWERQEKTTLWKSSFYHAVYMWLTASFYTLWTNRNTFNKYKVIKVTSERKTRNKSLRGHLKLFTVRQSLIHRS